MEGSELMALLLIVAIGIAIHLYHRLNGMQATLDALIQRVDGLERGEAWWRSPRPEARPASPPPDFDLSSPPAAPVAPPVVAPIPVQPQPQPWTERPAWQRLSQPAMSPAPEPAPQAAAPDFESLLGTSWLTRLGVTAIVLAVSFLLQYAFARIGPAAKVGIGLTVGLALYVSGQFLLRKPLYRNYGQIVSAGGVVAFFVSIYAAHNLFHLVGYWTAFGALAIPALLATVLAVRADTESLAVFCLLGAFAAPVMLHSGQGAPDPAGLLRLYGYLAFLNLWAAGLLRIKRWYTVPASALGATWLLFFTAGPLQGTGWVVEAFAALFLLLSAGLGLQTLYLPEPKTPGTTEDSTPVAQLLGTALVLAGFAAFSLASALILGSAGLFGWPALATAGIVVALLAAALAMTLPGETGASARLPFAYAACMALFLVVGLTSLTAQPIPHGQASLAFGFSVFTLLLFLGVAAAMTRSEGGREPACALVGAAALVHAQMAYHALAGMTLWSLPAAAVWLPVAGWVVLLSLLAARGQEKDDHYAATTAVTAQVLSAIGLIALSATGAFDTAQHAWSRPGAALFGGEFLILSATWLAMRARLRTAGFRADLLGAFGNAALFSALLWPTAGDASINGIVIVTAYAVALSLYHALVGGILLRNDDPLHRHAYLGLAVTFLTVSIPLQFKLRSVTTLAWAVEALALLRTGLLLRDMRTRWYGLTVLALAAGKALLFDIGMAPEPAQFLLNSRMLAGAAAIAAAYVAAGWLHRRKEEASPDEYSLVPALLTVANLLTLMYVSVDLWQAADRAWPDVRHGAAQLALSLFWTVYSLGAICIGIWKRSRPVRLFAMGLLYLSIFKVFLFDLSGLEQPYRIFSFLTLGVILLVISLLYTRFEEWLKETETTPAPTGHTGATTA